MPRAFKRDSPPIEIITPDVHIFAGSRVSVFWGDGWEICRDAY